MANHTQPTRRTTIMYDIHDVGRENEFEWGTNERATAADSEGEARSEPSRRTFLQGSVAVGAAATVGGLGSVAAADGTATRDVMFTGNAKDGTVSLSDADTYEDIGTIDTYPDRDREDALDDALDEVSPVLLNTLVRENYLEHANVSPDGRTLYASRGHVGDVVAIDIETREKLWETTLTGFRADHQTISPDGNYLYTSDLAADQVDKIDTETGTVVAEGATRDLPHGNHFHRLPAFGGKDMVVNGSLGNMLYPDATTGDPLKHRLTILDPDSMTPVRTVEFQNGVRPFAITDDGRTFYVQISYFHGFHEYDAVEDRVTRTKHLPKTEHVPANERDYPAQSAHHGIAISGDGKYICAAGTTSWYAAIVRRSDFELIATIPVGKYPYWVQTAPDGEHAFVPVRKENEISVINYADAEEIARIPTGDEPHVTEYEAVPKSML
jgi:DNA-binding beta-propeller fold protein YncE